MTDNNIDTPQSANPNDANQAFEGPFPTEDSSNNQTSVEEAFFGSQETATPTTEEASPQAGTPQPTEAPIQEQAQEYSAKNDEKRFEYWQSQAAKAQNQLAQQQQQIEQMQQMQMPQQQPVEQPVEKFPEPPARPDKPRGFSREEAFSDPSSDSARYLDEYESWRDDMTEYNSLRNEYNVALMQDRLDAQDKERQANIQRQQAYQAEQEQLRGVSEHLTGHYGFEANEAQEFIQTMSDPNSLSLDNLVQLYRLQKGQGQPDPNAGPSPEFQQTQRAQQIPSPMGVQTGQGGGNEAKSESDAIMDSMISDFNSKNPW
jgi:hypothetical protein